MATMYVATTAAVILNGPGDQINTDPLLGPLQNNGGPTFTHELLQGSPAIDAGDPNFTPPPYYDQRGPGFSRVRNDRIDVGSFEVQTVRTHANANIHSDSYTDSNTDGYCNCYCYPASESNTYSARLLPHLDLHRVRDPAPAHRHVHSFYYEEKPNYPISVRQSLHFAWNARLPRRNPHRSVRRNGSQPFTVRAQSRSASVSRRRRI